MDSSRQLLDLQLAMEVYLAVMFEVVFVLVSEVVAVALEGPVLAGFECVVRWFWLSVQRMAWFPAFLLDGFAVVWTVVLIPWLLWVNLMAL
jgi:hypothetical protein